MASAEIQELNLTYLMLAQRLLAKDRDMAMFQLQLNEEVADLLLSLSSRQLARLARVDQFLFRLRFDKSQQLSKLTQNEREQGLAQTHAALLLASSTPLTGMSSRQGNM